MIKIFKIATDSKIEEIELEDYGLNKPVIYKSPKNGEHKVVPIPNDIEDYLNIYEDMTGNQLPEDLLNTIKVLKKYKENQ